MSHWQLVIVLSVAPTLLGIVAFARRELRLQRAARDGYLVSYGITGRQRDLDAQIADLRMLHDAAMGVSGKSNVRPFPARRGGVAS